MLRTLWIAIAPVSVVELHFVTERLRDHRSEPNLSYRFLLRITPNSGYVPCDLQAACDQFEEIARLAFTPCYGRKESSGNQIEDLDVAAFIEITSERGRRDENGLVTSHPAQDHFSRKKALGLAFAASVRAQSDRSPPLASAPAVSRFGGIVLSQCAAACV